MRKKLEEAIKTLNLNLDVSFDMQYWEDANGNMIHVSPSCERITGYSANEFIENSKLFKSIILPEDLPKWNEHHESARKEDVHETQFRIKHKSGVVVWIEHVCQKLFDDEGKFQGFRASNRDISERKLTSDIYKTSPTVHFLWENREGWPVKFVSENIEHLSGYKKEDFLSSKISYIDIVHSEDIERVAEEVKTFSKMEIEDFKHKQYRIKTKKGETKWVDDNTHIIRDNDGKITHYQGSVTDITSEVETKLKLIESEKRYRTFVDNASDSFYLSDINGRIIDVNNAACKNLGYTRKELLKLSIMDIDFIFSFEKLLSTHTQIINKKLQNFESIHNRKNGESFPVEIRVSSFTSNKGQLFFSIARDITSRINAEASLKLSEKKHRTMIERSNDMIWIIDSKGNFTFFNNKVAKLAGLKFSEHEGKSFVPVVLEEDVPMLMKILDRTLGGEAIDYELRLPSPNGLLTIATNTAPMYDDNNQITGVISFGKDITERKKTEEELLKSENLYRSVFNHSPMGIFHFNTSGIITDCNEKFANIIGPPREQLIGFNLLKQLENKKIVKEIKRTLEIGIGYFEDEYKSVLSKKATPIIVRLNAIYDKEDRIISAVGLVEDITERKEAEKAASEQNFILENMNDFIYRQNVDGTFAYLSPGISKIVGFLPEEWETHFSNVITDNPINQAVINNTEDTLLRGIVHPPYEVEVYHKNGSRVMLEASEIPIVEFGKVVGLIGIGRDITEKKKSEKLQKALYRISEEAQKISTTDKFYKALHIIIKELMPAKNFYLAIHDTDEGMISFPYFIDEYDAPPPPQLFGNGLTEFVLKTKKSQILTEVRYKELQKNKEVELGESGKFSKIWVGIYLEFEDNHKGVLAIQDYENETAYNNEDLKVLQFVSEQIVKVLNKEYAEDKLRKYVKELFSAKEELELINSNKDRFFSIIAHDLRSPFIALMGISEMISEDMDSMSVGEVKEMTGAIYHSAQNLNKLIENLLNWSHLQMGTFKVSPKIINLKEISVNVVNILQLSAKEKNITIQDNIAEISLFADEDCAKTILRNLVNNAIKFTERGGEIKLSSKLNKELVEIIVEDNGVGIREEVLGKLFSITEKISEEGTEKEVGTGLGLILCKELVEKNNGKIWVESELGRGSKFVFTLPVNNNII